MPSSSGRKHLRRLIRLVVLPVEQRLADVQAAVVRISGNAFLGLVEGVRKIASRAIRVDDQRARAAILFRTQRRHLLERVDRRRIILLIAINLAQQLVQNRQRAAPRRA